MSHYAQHQNDAQLKQSTETVLHVAPYTEPNKPHPAKPKRPSAKDQIPRSHPCQPQSSNVVRTPSMESAKVSICSTSLGDFVLAQAFHGPSGGSVAFAGAHHPELPCTSNTRPTKGRSMVPTQHLVTATWEKALSPRIDQSSHPTHAS